MANKRMSRRRRSSHTKMMRGGAALSTTAADFSATPGVGASGHITAHYGNDLSSQSQINGHIVPNGTPGASPVLNWIGNGGSRRRRAAATNHRRKKRGACKTARRRR